MALTEFLTTDKALASVLNDKVVMPANAHIDSTSNPHGVTKEQVGLTNVTDDAQIPKSIIDAAGDLIYGTADNTPARLEKGTDGQVLKLESGLPSWVDGASPIINYTKIGEITTTAGQATVEFTSIPNSYDVLFIHASNLCLSSNPGDASILRMRLNSDDTEGNYETDGAYNDPDAGSIYAYTGGTYQKYGEIGKVLTESNSPAKGVIDLIIEQFDVSKYKRMKLKSFCKEKSSSSFHTNLDAGGIWKNTTSKISTIAFYPSSGLFGVECKFVIYGGSLNV